MRLPSFVHQAIALPTLACDAQYAPSASHARTLSQQRHIAWPNLATSSPPRSEAVPGPIAASFRPWPCLDLSIPSLAHAKEGREPLATATASPTHSRSLSLPYAHTTPTSLSLSLLQISPEEDRKEERPRSSPSNPRRIQPTTLARQSVSTAPRSSPPQETSCLANRSPKHDTNRCAKPYLRAQLGHTRALPYFSLCGGRLRNAHSGRLLERAVALVVWCACPFRSEGRVRIGVFAGRLGAFASTFCGCMLRIKPMHARSAAR